MHRFDVRHGCRMMEGRRDACYGRGRWRARCLPWPTGVNAVPVLVDARHARTAIRRELDRLGPTTFRIALEPLHRRRRRRGVRRARRPVRRAASPLPHRRSHRALPAPVRSLPPIGWTSPTRSRWRCGSTMPSTKSRRRRTSCAARSCSRRGPPGGARRTVPIQKCTGSSWRRPTAIRPATLDESFIVDIDLSSFGLPWEEFLSDSRAVRAEFSQVTDAEFYPRQKKFLESLVARPAFCFTEFFQDRHEDRARGNIERLFEKLGAEGRL